MTPDLPQAKWRKATCSGGEGGNCVEVHPAGAVRDSKNPAGPTILVELGGLLAAVRGDRLSR